MPVNQRLSATSSIVLKRASRSAAPRNVDERRDPAQLAHVACSDPFVDDQRRRRAERHHVGEAVVLGAERALRAGEPRDAAVEAVEHHRDEDGDRRLVEAQVHRLHDRVEAGEQRRRS